VSYGGKLRGLSPDRGRLAGLRADVKVLAELALQLVHGDSLSQLSQARAAIKVATHRAQQHAQHAHPLGRRVEIIGRKQPVRHQPAQHPRDERWNPVSHSDGRDKPCDGQPGQLVRSLNDGGDRGQLAAKVRAPSIGYFAQRLGANDLCRVCRGGLLPLLVADVDRRD
jgi:hypothetical protein